jgi:hypothetical protein
MVARGEFLSFLSSMSEPQNPIAPPREIIAPRHESLTKEFHGEIGPRPLEYGEGRLWLVARDPHWLFAYWQFVPGEHPATVGEDGRPHFFLRVLGKDGRVEVEIDVIPEQANVYIPVEKTDSSYTAELGFFTTKGIWCFIAKSGTAYTPPSVATDHGPALYATVPASLPLGNVSGKVLIPVQRRSEWTLEQELMFAHLLAVDAATVGLPEGRAKRARSRMVSPKKRGIPEHMLASLDCGNAISSAETASSWSSNPDEAPPLHLNAEIIFYGATASDGSLSIAGEPVQLRHDGTFRVHCRLPDGEFEIPVVATSADGKHTRNAVLRFSRETEADAGTGVSPQPDYLPPLPGKTPPA